MSAIFYHIFIFHQIVALQKLWKMFLFHLKSSFRSQDIQILVFPSSSLFLPISYCFRGWSKINLNVDDIINCPSKKLITDFIWYLEKEKRYGIETLSIDKVLKWLIGLRKLRPSKKVEVLPIRLILRVAKWKKYYFPLWAKEAAFFPYFYLCNYFLQRWAICLRSQL